jgi:hypothetical protein
MARIRFYAETGSKTIIEGYARVVQGWNEMEDNVIRDNAIDTLPYVRMPENWQTPVPQFHTTAPAPKVKAGEIKPEDFTYHGDARKEPVKDAEKKAKEIKDQQSESQWSPMRVMATDFKCAQVLIAAQKDVPKLVELLQFAKSKPEYKKAVLARIKELDPDNSFAASFKPNEPVIDEDEPSATVKQPATPAPAPDPPKEVDKE